MQKVLILVDLQNDFMPSGALPVPRGNEIIPLANALQAYFTCIVATQDWHPRHHTSFALNHVGRLPGDRIKLAGLTQILWPVHCVQATAGAELVTDLQLAPGVKIFRKGSDPDIDSYSGFFDNGHRKSTGLADYLQARQVKEVYVMGLALDYCVKYTVLDACQLGFKTFLIEDACRGVNVNAQDSAVAIKDMQAAGAIICQSADILTTI
jgi:nicotinamidase/pyrazinamidase